MTAIPAPTAAAHDQASAHEHDHEELSFIKRYFFSTDHKIIGIEFLFFGLLFFIVGGLLAMLVRWQLAWPKPEELPWFAKYINWQGFTQHMGWPNGVMPPEVYNQFFTMHATIMIFFVIIPILVGAFGNYLIPLMIGAKDMAFPFLNGMAFWLALPAGAIMVAAFFLPGGTAAAGWTSYPPLSSTFPNHVEYHGRNPYIGSVPWTDESAQYTQALEEFRAAPSSKTRMALVAAFIDKSVQPLRLRIGPSWQSSWPAVSLISITIAWFLSYLYICAYQIRLGIRPLNWLVGIALSAVGAFFTVKFVQYMVFDGQSAWFFSLFLLGFSSIMGAVNYLTTVVKLRSPGMTMFRMPLSVWALFITSVMVLLATPVLAATLFLNLLDHHRLTSFFLPYNWVFNQSIQSVPGGGYPLLAQHLFWFYSHPAVYIMILPAMGMVSDVIAVNARKAVFGYRPMIYALASIAFLGFIVWAHHMFQSGLNPTLGTTFAISTMFIAVPSAIKVFNWLGTIWGGNIRYTAAMLNAIAFVAMFVIGGMSGIYMASTSVDVHIHGTYFIVAHIHYVLFGASMFGIFAGIYHWYPKMFGKMMSERLGTVHFWISFIAFNCTFFPMHILGLHGMPRRVAEYTQYSSFAQFQGMNIFITYSAFVLGLAQLLLVVNFIGSWFWGKRAGRNPWDATTLEWETPSPPGHGNFPTPPVVYHGPYEYASPLVEEDHLLQTRFVEGADAVAAAH
ncbi:MAG TPA: cbb3-type cytochrome c oxidase subunit I [Tepidisphaeraceae bacterium]|jgi:heme/copper-type cytochrome/quinol oxidase subunit 1|nr:cbb3-type cytochrome c oxidase subunit I [Tepidisphaeraceae bacterium]